MGERTSHAPGTFSWADLGTDDAAGAKDFYGGLFGWELEDLPVPSPPPYTMARIGDKAVAAMYERQQRQGPPAWLSYVTVENADATAAKASDLGAAAIQEPFDVMEAGRMAVLQDPTGAVFGIWQAGESIGAELVNDPGAMTLNQLNTSDAKAALSFYEALFGWRSESVEGGPAAYWGLYNGDRLNGGAMELDPGSGTPSHWLVYFTSTDLEEPVAKITEGDGRVVIEPMPVPGGRIAVAQDPQGATFGLFEGEVDD